MASIIKKGHILGIDSSEEMIAHANQSWSNKRLSFEAQNIEAFAQPLSFDFVLSFWCLHWTGIELSIPNIFHTLKDGGRVYAVLSSFSDNSVLYVWEELVKQKRYIDLAQPRVDAQKKSTHYFARVMNVVNQLPFKQVRLDLKNVRVHFPHMDYFKNLLLTLPFIEQLPVDRLDDVIDALLEAFQTICQRKFGGALYYETRPIFLQAIK